MKGTYEEIVDFNLYSLTYFSSYIEATVLEVEEAEKISQSQPPIAYRGRDSKEVVGLIRLRTMKIPP